MNTHSTLSFSENDSYSDTFLKRKQVSDIIYSNNGNPNHSEDTINMIGARLKLGRLSNGLSLQDLSDILMETGDPITRAGLSKYETGKVIPNDKILEKIAKIMDLDISYFYKDHFPDYQIMTMRPVQTKAGCRI